jgi:ATP-dependent DNA ligase
VRRTSRPQALPAVSPIIPVVHGRPFDDPAYLLFESKYDGFRGTLYLTGREATFRSKRGLPRGRPRRLGTVGTRHRQAGPVI